jgi:hypothetical protein
VLWQVLRLPEPATLRLAPERALIVSTGCRRKQSPRHCPTISDEQLHRNMDSTLVGHLPAAFQRWNLARASRSSRLLLRFKNQSRSSTLARDALEAYSIPQVEGRGAHHYSNGGYTKTIFCFLHGGTCDFGRAYGTSGVYPSREATLECTLALVPRAYFVLVCVHFTPTFLKEIFRFDFRR